MNTKDEKGFALHDEAMRQINGGKTEKIEKIILKVDCPGDCGCARAKDCPIAKNGKCPYDYR